jgi:GT2 family glycosyltransferase/glycosyltransferase involved in cell wall biosynthesis
MQIFVLGMHRSGTSMLTRLINLMGAYVGGEGDTTDAAGVSEENPKGFWERADVRDADETLLDAVGCDWERIARWDHGRVNLRTLDVFEKRARGILVKLDAHRPWVVKDPRLCLTFAHWRPLLEQPLVFLPIRDPHEVAMSLETRNEFPLELGLALWEKYVLSSLAGSVGVPRVLVHHADLMRDPVATLEDTLRRLRDLGVSDGLRMPKPDAVHAFVDARLHRAVVDSSPRKGDDHAAIALHVSLLADGIPDSMPELSERSRKALEKHDQLIAKRVQRLVASGSVAAPIAKRPAGPGEREVRLAGMLVRSRMESSRLRAAGRQERTDAEARQRVQAARQEMLERELGLRSDTLADRTLELQRANQRVNELSALHAAAQQDVVVSRARAAEAEATVARLAAERVELRGSLLRVEHESRASAEVVQREMAALRARLEVADKARQELTTTRKRLDAAEVRLAEARRQREKHEDLKRSYIKQKDALASARASIAAQDGANRMFRKRLSEAARLFDAHLGSARWRVGNRIVRLVERLLLRGRQKLASELLKERLHALDKALHEASLRQIPGGALSAGAVAVHVDGKAGAEALISPSAFAREPVVPPLFDLQADPVIVVIPVYNAPDAVQRCLTSVLSGTRGHWRLLVIDDASPDPRIGQLLAAMEARASDLGIAADFLSNTKNLGFVETVNLGFSHSRGDVVILNSDTEVSPGWLARLSHVAGTSNDVATVTPLSNNAGPFSVVESDMQNDFPAGLDLRKMDRIVRRAAARERIELPTGHGFCMYIRRDALDRVGMFDAERFPRGYGEENDFCMRAVKSGMRNLVDDGVFVYHERSASFGDEKRELLARNRGTLDLLHPEYTGLVRAAFSDERFTVIADRVARLIAAGPPRPRLLFVIHAGGGGTTQTNLDLMRELQDCECYLLEGSVHGLELKRLDDDGTLQTVEHFSLERRWNVRETRRADYARIYRKVLIEYAIDLAHVRHIIAHTLDLIDVLQALDVPMILSLHDFYMICPTIQLIDSQNRYCGGVCHRQSSQCSYSKSWLGEQQEPLSHWNADWRHVSNEVIASASHLITTTESARATLLEGVIAARSRPFSVIEHGRNFANAMPARHRPQAGEPLRILVPGQLGNCKGTDLLRRIKQIDTNNLIEFHFLGKGSDALSGIGVAHGEYSREDFHERVAAIGPSLSAILSIWPETYCHTLSESWASGLPVVASRIGALEERVLREGGGWLVDVEGASMFMSIVEMIASDPAAYDGVAAQVDAIRMPGTSQMASQYRQIYATYLAPAGVSGMPISE